MDLRQLAALVAVAEEGSFSAAARALHTVQSNVSTHVARLEQELGALLVDRSSGTLTDEGELVVDRARRVRHELDALQADVASLLHAVSGEVRLGCIGTVARWLIPRLLRLMSSRHPEVRVVALDATTTSLVPQVVAETLDLAVLNLPLADPELETEALFDEDRILIAPTHHPLASRVCIDMTELAQHELLLEPRGTPFRDELDGQATLSGVTLRPRAEVDGIRLLTTLAFEGFGPAVVPATATTPWVDGTCRKIAVDGLTPRAVGLARSSRGRLSAPARAVRDAIRDLVVDADVAGIHPTLTA
jgi:DNA-binding transcriptional LysR family regulator